MWQCIDIPVIRAGLWKEVSLTVRSQNRMSIWRTPIHIPCIYLTSLILHLLLHFSEPGKSSGATANQGGWFPMMSTGMVICTLRIVLRRLHLPPAPYSVLYNKLFLVPWLVRTVDNEWITGPSLFVDGCCPLLCGLY